MPALRRRSRMVRTLRWALPAAAGALVLTLGVQMVMSAAARRSPHQDQPATVLQMTNPRFIGRDERGRPFRILAKTATRNERDASQIILEQPDVSVGEGAEVSRALAQSGVYSEKDRILNLSGDVRLDDGKGNRFTSSTAVVDTRAGSVKGGGPVTGEGPKGDLSAREYDVQDKGDKVTFRGRVRTRINRD
jgi:lipopolysaccharide export system protein LptC